MLIVLRRALVTVVALWCVACAAHDDGADAVDGGAGDAIPSPDGVTPPGGTDGGTNESCESPPTAAGDDVVIAPEFAGLYSVYDLGPVPGVPSPLGGCILARDDPNTLLIAGGSETAGGAIYAIGLRRGPCGHILGFEGEAELVANTPYVDANLVFTADDTMLYTEWPQFMLSQLPAGATEPARRTDLRDFGLPSADDSGAGGFGVVPPGLLAEGEYRAVTWPVGRWIHVDLEPDGALFTVAGISEAVTVPNGPGGFAYVPAGSPGFDAQSIILAEWSQNKVAVYEADQQGDPTLATRKDFFTTFPRPWGAYFEPVTGDYLFLTWGGYSEDRVFIVQGFVPPPVID